MCIHLATIYMKEKLVNEIEIHKNMEVCKQIEDLNNTISHLDLINIYWILQQRQRTHYF